VRRPAHLQSTARGVALLAGIQAGLINSVQDLESLRTNPTDVFDPSINAEQRQDWLKRWSDAISRSLRWHG
jgi:glycerol kinase